MPIRIQRKRTKGFNLQAESLARNGLPCVSVTRPGEYGNPFQVGDYVTFPQSSQVIFWKCWEAKHAGPGYQHLETAEQVLDAYRTYLSRIGPAGLDRCRRELGGKNLACWCKEGEPCHADILLEAVNG